ncbi:glycosyltransferase family 4 protein [Pseudomonas fluorescens]|jgi:Fuc2NAc and GlcNAc transferase|nr:glycosyltransferase family 4 protein [Pseudomonas fluorescens]
MIFGWLLSGVYAASWLLTLVLRRYALSKSLMDIPNERSSHTVPTPRGGGVAIVVSFAFAVPVLANIGLLNSDDLYGLLGSGSIVAVIGFADDHGHIAARWRLLGHFGAALWALFWLNGLPPISIFDSTLDMAWLGYVFGAVYLVWMLNLYNFMDGIDGLASAEALSACLGMCLVYGVSGNTELIFAPLLLAAAVAGFICWNFPSARIFMGDAGSGFLGIMLAFMSLADTWNNPDLIWCWLILLGVFVMDATWTLGSRFLRGEKIYEAHRCHAYQHAARVHASHKAVTLGAVALNVFWLLPIALAVATGLLVGIVGLAIAYFPLMMLCWYYKGGYTPSGD